MHVCQGESERDGFYTEFCTLWFFARTAASRSLKRTFPALAFVVGNGKFKKD